MNKLLSHMNLVANDLGDYAQHYLAFHQKRFIKLLQELLPKAHHNNAALLELGAFFPFTACLPSLGYSVIEAGDMPVWTKENFTLPIKMIDGHVKNFSVKVFNVERDPFPYSDKTFDIVLFLEIIEHLAYDPMFALSEINRILKLDGLLVISTPNICSLHNIERILKGYSPISNQIFVPDNLYARHNSELSAHELELLLKSSGFEIDLLTSEDFMYDTLNSSFLDNSSIKFPGDTLYCVAKKTSNVLDRYPSPLYINSK